MLSVVGVGCSGGIVVDRVPAVLSGTTDAPVVEATLPVSLLSGREPSRLASTAASSSV